MGSQFRLFVLLVIVAVAFTADAAAGTWYILPEGGGDAPTIQAGIDLAAAGDTVLLADGTYTGDGNRDIDYHGKEIVVRSQSGDPELCVIDCQGSESDTHRGFTFQNGEDTLSVLSGVTIQNGYCNQGAWPNYHGGAILCNASSPAIRNNIFSNNFAVVGGAVYIYYDAAPLVIDNIFQNNEAMAGGALYNYGTPLIAGNSFVGDTAYSDGGAIKSTSGHITVIDNEFINNDAGIWGGAIMCYGGSGEIVNNLFEENACYDYGDTVAPACAR
ncbi:MAG TPA: right-handed parallel beta-helix repeat-containing protein [Patescibacteria group bacterium]|nr:right-handed parallel beta-helix repeat-containing protein [Patescibacteria group bacterium]